jgi:hypothetical protein
MTQISKQFQFMNFTEQNVLHRQNASNMDFTKQNVLYRQNISNIDFTEQNVENRHFVFSLSGLSRMLFTNSKHLKHAPPPRK